MLPVPGITNAVRTAQCGAKTIKGPLFPFAVLCREECSAGRIDGFQKRRNRPGDESQRRGRWLRFAPRGTPGRVPGWRSALPVALSIPGGSALAYLAIRPVAGSPHPAWDIRERPCSSRARSSSCELVQHQAACRGSRESRSGASLCLIFSWMSRNLPRERDFRKQMQKRTAPPRIAPNQRSSAISSSSVSREGRVRSCGSVASGSSTVLSSSRKFSRVVSRYSTPVRTSLASFEA